MNPPGAALAIILGASEWPRCDSLAEVRGRSQVFARSHSALLDALTGHLGAPSTDGSTRLLDLFDSSESRDQVAERVSAFVKSHRKSATDLLIFFLGHGHYDKDSRRTYLLTKNATRDFAGTGLDFEWFEKAIVQDGSGGDLRHYYFVNACHAEGLVEHVRVKPFESPKKGVCGAAGLFSCGSDDAEPTELPQEGLTPFLAALTHVLRRHVEPKAVEGFTLSRLTELVAARVARWNRAPGAKYPLPRCRVIRASWGAEPGTPDPLIGSERVLPNPAAKLRWCLLLGEQSARDPNREQKLTIAVNKLPRTIGAGVKAVAGRPFPAESCPVVRADAAVADAAAFRDAVATVCGSDFVAVDLSGYEPVVMLLLGLRAVVRRGVTICLNYPDPTQPFPPFYLQDVAWLNATAKVTEFEKALADRVAAGFQSLRAAPSRYADLPVYDAVRRQSDSERIAPIHNQILVLCPYSLVGDTWEKIQARAEEVLGARIDHRRVYPVRRVMDLPSGLLTSLAAFEAIRRADVCLIDWTDWRANVFFELGIRLATNPRGAIVVIDGLSPAWTGAGAQADRLRRVFAPVEYDRAEPYGMLDRVLEKHFADADAPAPVSASGIGSIYPLIWDSVHPSQATELRDVCDLLTEAAQPYFVRAGDATASDSLYPETHELRALAPNAARERLLAAWLYLRYRYGRDRLLADRELRAKCVGIATNLLSASVDFPREGDGALIGELEAFLSEFAIVE